MGLFLLFPLLLAAVIIQIVWCIKGAIAASKRQPWRYPLSIRMVRS